MQRSFKYKSIIEVTKNFLHADHSEVILQESTDKKEGASWIFQWSLHKDTAFQEEVKGEDTCSGSLVTRLQWQIIIPRTLLKQMQRCRFPNAGCKTFHTYNI